MSHFTTLRDVWYPPAMPHRVLQSTVEALQVPAGLIAVYTGTEILASNRRALTEVSENLLVGSNYEVVMKELGREQAAHVFAQVASGEERIACQLIHLKSRMDTPAWYICSMLPEIQGWPPCVLVTLNTQAVEEQVALDFHVRDRLAVEMSILLDTMRSDTRQVARMATAAWQQVDHMAQSFVERLNQVEPQLPQG